ncbi:MAG: hypothetical protein ACFFD8_05570 [Candidatus Thorarchaeota archaeon]
MSQDRESWDNIELDEASPSGRRQAIGCCAILIIMIFALALLVGYASWFYPYIP